MGVTPGNRFVHLDSNDPFYPGLSFPKLTTPQWVRDEGVDAIVILAVDDMTDSKAYERFLRPILNRLKQIDGKAPGSIMTRSVPVDDEQVQRWLREGLSLEVHTVKHPCPLLADGNFAAAASTYYDCVDLLSRIPGNKPVAFRMPCCDSMDSASPRFYAEIFSRRSPAGNFLSIDSSVVHRFTTNDNSLPAELVKEGRFARYFPAQTNAMTRIGLGAFSTTIEDYPYPYVIGNICWEFPCAAPSDWEAFNAQGATNEQTVADWKAALDATVLKQGVMTMVFHPHGWIRNDQMVALIDYAAARYGKRIEFLNFRQAYARLNKNLLGGKTLRGAEGEDTGVRLMDVDGDGFMDVIVPEDEGFKTRLWDASGKRWKETANSKIQTSNLSKTPNSKHQNPTLKQMRFGVLDGEAVMFYRTEDARGAWRFSGGRWHEDTNFFSGLSLGGTPILTQEKGRDRGVRMRDVDNDGLSEILVANETQNAVFGWFTKEKIWKKLNYALPAGASIVNAAGEDNGLRFVDLNGDGYDDVLFSNEKGYGAYVFIAKKTWLGWNVGWSYQLRAGKRGDAGEIPMIVRPGPHRNNGAWFKNSRMFVQNEDTSKLPDHVAQLSFQELMAGDEAPPKSPQEGLAAFRVPAGFKMELVASEPTVIDPVAIDWAPDGRMWVVEMRDYPLGMDGKGKPGGVVKVLEDTKQNGFYDKATVFIEGLRFPNGVMQWGKGVLISAAPDIIYAEDTDGDGKADVQKVLFTGFNEGNQQHRINGFEYGLDNWLYLGNGGSGGAVKSSATGRELELRGRDLRIRPDDGLMELEPGQTQFGRHRDDWGNWFGNDNGTLAWHYYLPERYLARNPRLAAGSMLRRLANYANQNRLYPVCPGQQRFNFPQAVKEVTSACSATPYRDALFPPEFQHSLLICEPANCLVHREVLEEDGISFQSHRAKSDAAAEFLASADNWCRPVMAKTGPDGAVYIVDMYRKIIEHPEYFPEEVRQRPDLRAGEDKGRIYRIYPTDATLGKVPRLDKLDAIGLADALDSPNGWQRDMAQRLIVRSGDKRAVPALMRLLEIGANPKARLQALAALQGLDAVTPKILLHALADPHWAVRRHAVLLSEPHFETSATLAEKLVAMTEDSDLRVRYQLAFSLGEWKGAAASQALLRLAERDWDKGEMQIAILSSVSGHAREILKCLLARNPKPKAPDGLLEKMVEAAAVEENSIAALLQDISSSSQRDAATLQQIVAGILDAIDGRHTTLAALLQKSPKTELPIRNALAPVFGRARATATNYAAPEPERLSAIRFLGRGFDSRQTDLEILGLLLGARNPESIQKAALVGLRKDASARSGEILAGHWAGSAPLLRQEILNTLLTRKEWIDLLLDRVEQKAIAPQELGAPARQKLLKGASEDVRKRAETLFTSINVDRQKVIESYRIVNDLPGDREKGHTLFLQNCSICHRLRDEGKTVGPDLGTVATKPVQELLVAILDPNQAVDPAYTSYSITTTDDRDLSGILVSETANSIVLRSSGGTDETVLRSNIRDFKTSGRSLMPEGFETALKPQDVADLIAYIVAPR